MLPLTAETSQQNNLLSSDPRRILNDDDSDNQANGLSPVPTQRQAILKNKADIQVLKDIDKTVMEIETKLRQTNMIKGHANKLKKLQTDVQKQILTL